MIDLVEEVEQANQNGEKIAEIQPYADGSEHRPDPEHQAKNRESS